MGDQAMEEVVSAIIINIMITTNIIILIIAIIDTNIIISNLIILINTNIIILTIRPGSG